MRTTSSISALILLSIIALGSPSSCLGQGSLTPPGAPTPTMKTLAQIEPRTPISSAPYTITSPGSYYLTTNLTISSGAAITISANNVTLNLGGFTLTSTENPASASTGIQMNLTVTNITILNGFIFGALTNNSAGAFGGPGFAAGIYDVNANSANVRVQGVSISGCKLYGTYLGANSVAESCTATTVGEYGILASVANDCSGQNCGYAGIDCNTANNCYGQAIGLGTGVSATTANNCYGYAYGSGDGISTTIANNCYGTANGTGYGIFASSTATGCYGSSSQFEGINASCAVNCSGSTSSGQDGLTATLANNCYGSTQGNTGGYGLYCGSVATGCQGYNGSSGVGLGGFIVNGCRGENEYGSSISATHNIDSY
jgi:hypothetical protein